MIIREIDLEQLGAVKASVDTAGHHKRSEVLGFEVNKKMTWDVEMYMKGRDSGRVENAVGHAIDQGTATEKVPGVHGAGEPQLG